MNEESNITELKKERVNQKTVFAMVIVMFVFFTPSRSNVTLDAFQIIIDLIVYYLISYGILGLIVKYNNRKFK